jgi:hypothetical protein
MTLHDLNQAAMRCLSGRGRPRSGDGAHAQVVLGFQLLFRRWLTPLLRYALGILVLVRLLLPEVPASNFSIFNLKHTWADLPLKKSPYLLQILPFSSD